MYVYVPNIPWNSEDPTKRKILADLHLLSVRLEGLEERRTSVQNCRSDQLFVNQ